MFDGTEGDQVEACLVQGLLVGTCAESFGGWIRLGALLKKLLGAAGEYIDVRQCKGAEDFAEERGLFLIGLDQGEADWRGPEFDGDAGESGAGTEVGCGNLVVGPWSLVVRRAAGG
jgi:hypothetical protein